MPTLNNNNNNNNNNHNHNHDNNEEALSYVGKAHVFGVIDAGHRDFALADEMVVVDVIRQATDLCKSRIFLFSFIVSSHRRYFLSIFFFCFFFLYRYLP